MLRVFKHPEWSLHWFWDDETCESYWGKDADCEGQLTTRSNFTLRSMKALSCFLDKPLEDYEVGIDPDLRVDEGL